MAYRTVLYCTVDRYYHHLTLCHIIVCCCMHGFCMQLYVWLLVEKPPLLSIQFPLGFLRNQPIHYAYSYTLPTPLIVQSFLLCFQVVGYENTTYQRDKLNTSGGVCIFPGECIHYFVLQLTTFVCDIGHSILIHINPFRVYSIGTLLHHISTDHTFTTTIILDWLCTISLDH